MIVVFLHFRFFFLTKERTATKGILIRFKAKSTSHDSVERKWKHFGFVYWVSSTGRLALTRAFGVWLRLGLTEHCHRMWSIKTCETAMRVKINREKTKLKIVVQGIERGRETQQWRWREARQESVLICSKRNDHKILSFKMFKWTQITSTEWKRREVEKANERTRWQMAQLWTLNELVFISVAPVI